MPAEGLVLTIQKVTKVPFSRVKVIFDVTSVSFAAILLFTFYGNIIGLGREPFLRPWVWES